MLEPVWSCGPVLPNSLVDLLDTGDRDEEEEEEENEDEFDFGDAQQLRKIILACCLPRQ